MSRSSAAYDNTQGVGPTVPPMDDDMFTPSETGQGEPEAGSPLEELRNLRREA